MANTQAMERRLAGRIVRGAIAYVLPGEGLRYHANDSSRDTIQIERAEMPIEDARSLSDPPRLDREGFMRVDHVSAVRNFRDREEIERVHVEEVRTLLMAVSGADAVNVSGAGVLRFAERSALSGKLGNSRPARFAHVDISDGTAARFADRSNPRPGEQPVRVCHYNVWRVLSPPPQDAPLALCDARTAAPQDLLPAEAVFDRDGQPVWSFEGLVVAHNSHHRWVYYAGLTRDEVLIFVTNDSARGTPHSVPHVAFDDPTCPADVEPRASIEMRGIAYWY